jgi:hypothetical protein
MALPTNTLFCTTVDCILSSPPQPYHPTRNRYVAQDGKVYSYTDEEGWCADKAGWCADKAGWAGVVVPYDVVYVSSLNMMVRWDGHAMVAAEDAIHSLVIDHYLCVGYVYDHEKGKWNTHKLDSVTIRRLLPHEETSASIAINNEGEIRKLTVNGREVPIDSYTVQTGDTISIEVTKKPPPVTVFGPEDFVPRKAIRTPERLVEAVDEFRAELSQGKEEEMYYRKLRNNETVQCSDLIVDHMDGVIHANGSDFEGRTVADVVGGSEHWGRWVLRQITITTNPFLWKGYRRLTEEERPRVGDLGLYKEHMTVGQYQAVVYSLCQCSDAPVYYRPTAETPPLDVDVSFTRCEETWAVPSRTRSLLEGEEARAGDWLYVNASQRLYLVEKTHEAHLRKTGTPPGCRLLREVGAKWGDTVVFCHDGPPTLDLTGYRVLENHEPVRKGDLALWRETFKVKVVAGCVSVENYNFRELGLGTRPDRVYRKIQAGEFYKLKEGDKIRFVSQYVPVAGEAEPAEPGADRMNSHWEVQANYALAAEPPMWDASAKSVRSFVNKVTCTVWQWVFENSWNGTKMSQGDTVRVTMEGEIYRADCGKLRLVEEGRLFTLVSGILPPNVSVRAIAELHKDRRYATGDGQILTYNKICGREYWSRSVVEDGEQICVDGAPRRFFTWSASEKNWVTSYGDPKPFEKLTQKWRPLTEGIGDPERESMVAALLENQSKKLAELEGLEPGTDFTVHKNRVVNLVKLLFERNGEKGEWTGSPESIFNVATSYRDRGYEVVGMEIVDPKPVEHIKLSFNLDKAKLSDKVVSQATETKAPRTEVGQFGGKEAVFRWRDPGEEIEKGDWYYGGEAGPDFHPVRCSVGKRVPSDKPEQIAVPCGLEEWTEGYVEENYFARQDDEQRHQKMLIEMGIEGGWSCVHIGEEREEKAATVYIQLQHPDADDL